MNERVKEWIKFAEQDLKTAELKFITKLVFIQNNVLKNKNGFRKYC